jgi:predicted nucleotidyltransferase
MALPALARDFKEFLKSLNSNGVEYLLIGGYAVAIHGHIRATNDLDIWANISPENAQRLPMWHDGYPLPIGHDWR